MSAEFHRGVQQSLALYAFPCPPLPHYVIREHDGSIDKVSSHDMLETVKTVAFRTQKDDAAANIALHLENLQQYNAAMDALYPEYRARGRSASLALRIYETMKTYTRQTVAAYMRRPPESVDMRFAPLDVVERRHVIHQRAAEHLSLHRQMAGRQQVELSWALSQQYEDLIFEFFARHCEDGGEHSGAPI